MHLQSDLCPDDSQLVSYSAFHRVFDGKLFTHAHNLNQSRISTQYLNFCKVSLLLIHMYMNSNDPKCSKSDFKFELEEPQAQLESHL